MSTVALDLFAELRGFADGSKTPQEAREGETAPNPPATTERQNGANVAAATGQTSGGRNGGGSGGSGSEGNGRTDTQANPTPTPAATGSSAGAATAAEPWEQSDGRDSGAGDQSAVPLVAGGDQLEFAAGESLSGERFADACAEVSSLTVPTIARLPLPTTLLIDFVHPQHKPFVVTWSRAAFEAARVAGVIALKGGEASALALCAANDRGGEACLRDWLYRKAREPKWDLTPTITVAGLPTASVKRGKDGFGDVRLRDVVRAFGARVVAVGVGDDEGVALVQGLVGTGATGGKAA